MNPKPHLLFLDDQSGFPDGHVTLSTSTMGYYADNDRWDPAVFSGLHGADRNANGKLDRGPLPTSTRLYAVQVARFNVYDPRVPVVLR